MITEKVSSVFIHIVILALIAIFRDQFLFKNAIYSVLSLIIAIIGIVLLSIGRIAIDKAFISKKERLITSGIYSKIRHPVYTGRILFFIGLALLFKSFIGIILVIALLVPFHIYKARKEEREMLRKFGNKYAKYKKSTLF
ncbi:MAG: isoprenylcysteine carboxylmethyltransferase family protein [Candidatus Aenigmarchaeota archaeon]|nr:isoprenylcysteine carboxylmethyltransferase family protein [Candidatus Aenigmarchaeota archaeon]